MALYPNDGETAETLIKVADFRMYAAKHESRQAEQGSEDIPDHSTVRDRKSEDSW